MKKCKFTVSVLILAVALAVLAGCGTVSKKTGAMVTADQFKTAMEGIDYSVSSYGSDHYYDEVLRARTGNSYNCVFYYEAVNSLQAESTYTNAVASYQTSKDNGTLVGTVEESTSDKFSKCIISGEISGKASYIALIRNEYVYISVTADGTAEEQAAEVNKVIAKLGF